MARLSDHFAIQAKIDAVVAKGEKVVSLAAGEYSLRNAISLRTGVSLKGEGAATILRKANSFEFPIERDIRLGEAVVHIVESGAFRVGDGIQIVSCRAVDVEKMDVSLGVVREIHNGKLLLERPLNLGHAVRRGAKISLLHSLISATDVHDVNISALSLDGSSQANGFLNGSYGAGIFVQNSRRISIENISVNNFNGDGISWQGADDVLVKNCEVNNVSKYGLHPGSGSKRSQIINNIVCNAEIGLYFCWNVQHALAEKNKICHSLKHGISIGYHDTDNSIRDNKVADSGSAEIYFRDHSLEANAHRVLIEENHLVCERAGSIGIHLAGEVHDLIIRNNRIDVHDGNARNAIVIDQENSTIAESQNTIQVISP